MRLFIALPLEEGTRAALVRLQEEIRLLGQGGRFVPRANFHITLRFLGEAADHRPIGDAMNRAAVRCSSFDLALGRYGSFGRGDRKIAHCALTGDLVALQTIYERLSDELERLGFAREARGLTPHITLARDLAIARDDEENLKQNPLGHPIGVQSVVLYRSTQDPRSRQMIYTPLQTARLEA